MKKYIAYIFMIVSVLAKAQEQNFIVNVNAENKPLEFATVIIPQLNIGGTADSTGKFIFKNITEGKYELKVSFIGYFDVLKNIEVSKTNTQINIELKPTENNLNEVVVTGTMKEMTKAQSVVPVEIYTPKFFERNPTPTFFEAMQNINGVRPQMQCNVCNTGDIHINGMEGPYTMVLIDGMPIVSGLSTVYGLNGIPNSIVQRIEIVKGPAAALYGSEAMGGIINVITKDPKSVPRFAFDINGTTYQEFNADVATRFSIGKKVHSVLSGNFFNFNKRFDINKDNFTDVTLAKRASVFNKWTFDRKDNRVANVAFRYVYEDRFGGEMQYTPEFRGTDSIYAETIFTNRWEILGNYQLPTEREKVTLNYSINRHIQDSYYGTTKYFADQSIAFAQLVWDKKLNEKHDLLFGIAERATYYDDNTPLTDTPQLDENQPHWHYLTGAFAQDEIKINPKLKLLLGARYDYSSIHKHIFSPRFNIKYDADAYNSFRLSVGNGFRVVNVFSEDHAALIGGRTVLFLNELQPERSWSGNLNFTRFQNILAGFVNFDASIFYTFYNNRIIADYLTDPEKVIYDNIDGFATNYGASLSSDFTFKNGLKATLGTTFLRSYIHENNTRQEQIQVPRMTANYAISYSFKHNFSVDFTGYVNGKMLLPTLPNDYRPARSPFFNLSNIQITKQFSNGITIYGGVKNVFNFFPKEDPILRAFDPFDKKINDPINNPNGYTFDPSYNYAPIQKARGFVGLRMKIK
jgi:outer membrane receptor for ferrienterochelin and colicins